ANLLLDPVWGPRASPVTWAGPARHAPPGIPLEDLPPLHALLVTHDHYDHLDRPTIRAIAGTGARPSKRPLVVTPLGYRGWMRRQGVDPVRELGWGESLTLGASTRITAVPVRHWTRRSLLDRGRRLWCGYVVESAGFRAFSCGDSGWFEGFRVLGRSVAPLDLAILPIGAYEPRWFMRDHHMNPEEAVLAYAALGGTGLCMGVHWGTFVLTDEPLDEPPVRMRSAWKAARLPPERLWIPAHGETRVLSRGTTRVTDGAGCNTA
ncbi:MAG: MBL fold metallo-hydrolase, partial [Gemmatimonadetes bacterium]|nr:MBL fold metallo-hydrolase [Gemmatimonadota bacterium]